MGLGLERSFAALEALGSPHLAAPVMVVAGSNGKGSTSAMLERIAREAGLTTGLYTSPHMLKIEERVRVRGEPIDERAFADALERVFVDAPPDLTFFETLTMAGFVAFRDAAVDLAVLEVGLGGRLDATNVVARPLATAITSITVGDGKRWLEHADKLGNTIGEIAREKAGILRSGVPLALGPLHPEARRAILEHARQLGAGPIWQVGWADDDIDHEIDHEIDGDIEKVMLRPVGRSAAARMPDGAELLLEPRLLGRHQLENAGVAAAAALGASSRFPSLRASVERGIALASWPGRLERFDVEGREVWLDSAHNLDGARALVASACSLGWSPDRTTLVFGALADKAYEPALRLLATLASRRVYASPDGRAPAPLEALASIADGAKVGDPASAVDLAVRNASIGDIVLVTGSIYLVGAVRAHLLRTERDPAVGL